MDEDREHLDALESDLRRFMVLAAQCNIMCSWKAARHDVCLSSLSAVMVISQHTHGKDVTCAMNERQSVIVSLGMLPS